MGDTARTTHSAAKAPPHHQCTPHMDSVDIMYYISYHIYILRINLFDSSLEIKTALKKMKQNKKKIKQNQTTKFKKDISSGSFSDLT